MSKMTKQKMNNSNLYSSIETLLEFTDKQDLTATVALLEHSLKGSNCKNVEQVITQENVGEDVLKAALVVKQKISQIDVVIHAIGISNALPFLLDEDEVVEYVSLGAGNTGRKFDLETNKRIAEFKFINWSGKSDTIRQNTTFKDFFELAETETDKKKYLYILDKELVLKFFNNNRALTSVLSKNRATHENFFEKYGEQYKTVSQYYNDKKHMVEIVDMKDVCPNIFNK